MNSRRRWIALGVVAISMLLVVLGCVLWRASLTRQNNGTIEALRRAGFPTSNAELNTWYAAVPADENAALLLTEAMQALRNAPPELNRNKPRGLSRRGSAVVVKPDTETNAAASAAIKAGANAYAAAVKAYVATNQAALDWIKAALERPQCRYSVNFFNGLDSDWPHLEPLRNLAKLADYGAVLATERGDSHAATEQIGTIMALARTLHDEPIVISQLVRISILRMAVRRFERALSLMRFSEEDLGRLARVFAGAARSNCMTRAMIGE